MTRQSSAVQSVNSWYVVPRPVSSPSALPAPTVIDPSGGGAPVSNWRGLVPFWYSSALIYGFVTPPSTISSPSGLPLAPFVGLPSPAAAVRRLLVPLSSGSRAYCASHPSGRPSPSVSGFSGLDSVHASPASYTRLELASPSTRLLKLVSSPYPSLARSLSVSESFGSVSVHDELKVFVGQLLRSPLPWLGYSALPSPSTHPLRFASSMPSGIPS